jgi:hypothetical protein
MSEQVWCARVRWIINKWNIFNMAWPNFCYCCSLNCYSQVTQQMNITASAGNCSSGRKLPCATKKICFQFSLLFLSSHKFWFFCHLQLHFSNLISKNFVCWEVVHTQEMEYTTRNIMINAIYIAFSLLAITRPTKTSVCVFLCFIENI